MGASGAAGLAGYVVKRLLGMLLLLAGVTFIVFGMMYLAPGDVTVMLAASSPSPEQVAAIRREFGLDQPPWVQYGMFLRRVAHGDLGDSWIDRRPVMPQVLDAFGYTLRLAAVALGLSVVLGTAGGIVSAVRYRSATDESILSATLLGISVPVFVTGLLLIYTVRLQARMVPHLRRRDVAPSRPPRLHAGELPHGLQRPDDARVHARRAGAGLRADGPRQGRAGALGPRTPRLPERARADGDRGRPAGRACSSAAR